MTIDIEYLGGYGFKFSISSPTHGPKTVLIDPVLGRLSADAFLRQHQPNYILLTHYSPQWQDILPICAQSNATLVVQDVLAGFYKSSAPDLRPITMSFGHEIDFPWGEGNGSLVMTVSEHYDSLPNHPDPIQANGFIVNADGHQLYHAGPNQLSPELRTIGLTYKPDVAILPVASTGQLNPKNLSQAVMWLGCDIVMPIDVSLPDDDPVDMQEVYTTLDIYTPAICRMLSPGDIYTLQPTQSSGRQAGPESRY